MRRPTTHWSPDLRQSAESLEELRELGAYHEREIAKLRRDIATWETDTDRVRLARELQRYAVVLRLMDRLDGAEEGLIEARNLYEAAGRSRAVHLIQIRIANIASLKEQSDIAIRALDALSDRVTPAHLDLVYIYRGLAYARSKKPGAREKAEADLRAALTLRSARGRGEGELTLLLSLVSAEKSA